MNNTFNLLGEVVADDSQKWFPSDVVPAMVIGWLAKQDGDVEVNINSPGGDVTAGLAIANALKGYDRGKVTANVLGIAASMASVIACAADEVRMGKGAFFMIHNPWGLAVGEAEELRHQADVMDKMKASLIGFYLTKSEKTEEEIAAMMNEETWIPEEETEAYGFKFGKYTEEVKVAACLTRRAFNRAPEGALELYATREKPEELIVTADEWKARYQGASKKINDLQAEHALALEQASNDYKASLVEMKSRHEAEIKDLNDQLGVMRHDLEAAEAKLSSVTQRAEKAEGELAVKDEQLQRLESAHSLLTGGVLTPGDEGAKRSLAEISADGSLSPAQRSKLIAEGNFVK